MTPRMEALLRTLQAKPRTLRDLTNGEHGAHPTAITGWLDRLIDYGYVEPQGRYPAEYYHATELGAHYLANRPQIAPSRAFCNAAMRDPYVPPAFGSARPGADDHRRYRSRGIGA